MSTRGFSRLQRVARAVLDGARARGAEAAAVHVRTAWLRELVQRDGALERLEEATSTGLTLRLFARGRYGVFRTSDLRPDELQAFLGRAFDVVGALAPEPLRHLPEPALYRGRPRRDLGLVEARPTPEPDRLRDRLSALEVSARAASQGAAVATVEASVSMRRSRSLLLHSDGFRGMREASWYEQSAVVALRDDDERRPRDAAVDRARGYDDLGSPEALGRLAAERARARLGAEPAPTGVYPVVVEARAAVRLLSAWLDALQGPNLVQQRSFLQGRLGQRVASGVLTLTDDPLVPGGLGSRRFDAEGLAARRRVLVRRGVLQGLLLDTYHAGRLGAAPTSGTPSNVVVAPGARDLAGLIAEAGEGLLVTGFLGGNVNPTTADFSLGVVGSRLEGGRVGRAVASSNLTGNLLDLFADLDEVGSDVQIWSATRTPSLRFSRGHVSGR
jgi:PmbA protein